MKQHFLHRKGKTLLCMFTIIPLLLSTAAMINPGSGWVPPSPGTWVYIDPTSKIASVGETFNVTVNVFNVTNLYGFEFSLLYNTTIIDGLSVELPPDHFLKPVNPYKIYIQALDINDAYNATHGIVNATVMLLAPEPAKNGSGTLVAVTFKATALGEGDLNLGRMGTKQTPHGPVVVFIPDKIGLGDPDAIPIEHNKILGDVDGDGDVDYSDLSDLNKLYGSKLGDPNWNPNCDSNRDDKVDASDLFILSKNYGKTVRATTTAKLIIY